MSAAPSKVSIASESGYQVDSPNVAVAAHVAEAVRHLLQRASRLEGRARDGGYREQASGGEGEQDRAHAVRQVGRYVVENAADGRTRDRAERVARFETDGQCPVFLISLKAGGVGLNLTAADYVFLLDPWWNPAVEAQAIDRAHRIGQTRHVFAYRLIARDTVEEKIADLQATKRELADALLSEDAGLLRTLQNEDLEWLLS